MSDALARAIDERRAVVAVFGLGHIGLPLSETLVGAGFDVVGIDADAGRVERLAAGEDLLAHLGAGMTARLLATGRFAVTTDAATVARADVALLCVPTPLDELRRPDLGPVERTARAVADALDGETLVVLESTTWPGTTREVVAPILSRGGAREVLLAYSPERVDPGRDVALRAIPRLVAGLDARATDLAVAFYGAIADTVVPVGSPEVAEAAKLLENAYRAVNIALVNEIKTILGAMDLDVWEVLDAAETKPFGYQRFDPGPGMGGHCIPIDPFFLAWKAEQLGVPSRFVELAGEINREMPGRVAARAVGALAERGVAADGARVLLLGLAYKPDIDDVRNSPSLVIARQLEARGVAVDYHDPHVPASAELGRASVPLDEAAVAGYDAVLIATAHAAVDYGLVARAARLVVDTRNAMAGFPDATVVRA